ncbi:MAG: hypothetical protein U0Z53_28920 [Blastocatellia bacterium]
MKTHDLYDSYEKFREAQKNGNNREALDLALFLMNAIYLINAGWEGDDELETGWRQMVHQEVADFLRGKV